MANVMRLNLGKKFGAHVRALRHARELTQEELAERGELSVDAVRRIERGAFSPSLETVSKLATGLEVSLQTLFQNFDRDRRDQVAELCDYLGTRSRTELRVVWRVVRAMFEER
jgi:transcriptional regulator with XRE-family HTH domain